MTTLRYRERVRTRFVNILRKKVSDGAFLLKLDLDVADKKKKHCQR